MFGVSGNLRGFIHLHFFRDERHVDACLSHVTGREHVFALVPVFGSPNYMEFTVRFFPVGGCMQFGFPERRSVAVVFHEREANVPGRGLLLFRSPFDRLRATTYRDEDKRTSRANVVLVAVCCSLVSFLEKLHFTEWWDDEGHRRLPPDSVKVLLVWTLTSVLLHVASLWAMHG
jgi:hypothetical protein